MLKILRKESGINYNSLPFWTVFIGDISRDPCRVREVTCWFDDFSIDCIINKISIERLSLVLSYLIFYLFQNFVFIIGFVFLLLGIMNRIFLKNNLYLYWIIVFNFISIITIYTLTDANLDLMLRIFGMAILL